MAIDPTATAAQRLAAAQAALAQAQADAAAEAKATAAEGESQAAVDAEAALGKGIGGYVADLIRRLEALEAKVFPKAADSAPTSGSAPAVDDQGGYQ